MVGTPDPWNMTVAQPHRVVPEVAGAGTTLPLMGVALTDQPGERWKVTTGSTFVTVNEAGNGQDYPITQVALLYTDMNIAVRLRLVILDGSGATVYDGNHDISGDPLTWGAPAGYRHFLLHLPAAVVGSRLRIETNNQFLVGRVVIANAFQVEYNPDFGDTSWGFEEPPEERTLESGVTILEELPERRVLEFSITWASEEELETQWQRLAPLAHRGKPVMVVRRPDPYPYRHSGIFWGLLRLTPFVAAEFDMFEVKGKIKAMI